ncbi:MAG TPA: hypothetical protein VMV09_03590 [Candidatus Saccharimonadales bacterium]|nr:hypothetical protein [Candidatus Saccharimonadales bacterium]
MGLVDGEHVVEALSPGGHRPTPMSVEPHFLDHCPIAIKARMLAVLDAMATALPPAFSGGGFWEAMPTPMTGYHEVSVLGQPRGAARLNSRLFCYLDREGAGLPQAAIVLLDGRAKPLRSALDEADHAAICQLGDEYRARNTRGRSPFGTPLASGGQNRTVISVAVQAQGARTATPSRPVTCFRSLPRAALEGFGAPIADQPEADGILGDGRA